MEFKKLMTTAAIIGAVSFGATTASAQGSAKTIFDGEYPNNSVDCFVCHNASPGALTQYGLQYTANGGLKAGSLAAIQAVDTLDADGDGITNGAEITGGATRAEVTGMPASTGGSSGGGCVTASATTPLMMVLAMLTLGFFVRRKKD